MRRNGFGPAGFRFAFAGAIAAYAVVGLFSITGQAGQARQVTAGGSYSAALSIALPFGSCALYLAGSIPPPVARSWPYSSQ